MKIIIQNALLFKCAFRNGKIFTVNSFLIMSILRVLNWKKKKSVVGTSNLQLLKFLKKSFSTVISKLSEYII